MGGVSGGYQAEQRKRRCARYCRLRYCFAQHSIMFRARTLSILNLSAIVTIDVTILFGYFMEENRKIRRWYDRTVHEDIPGTYWRRLSVLWHRTSPMLLPKGILIYIFCIS